MSVLSSASAPTPRIRKEHWGRTSNSKSQNRVIKMPSYPTCVKYGRTHPGECFMGKRDCYGYGKLGYRIKECLYAKQGSRYIHPQTSDY